MPPGHLPVSPTWPSVVTGSGQVLGGLFFGHEAAAVFAPGMSGSSSRSPRKPP
jgi:hypothetical protein